MSNKKPTHKRYQVYGKHGIEWSPWFPYTGTPEKWQLKGKLLNEYKYEDDN